MMGGECRLTVVRDKAAKAVTLEKAGVRQKRLSFELKPGVVLDVTVRIPA